MMRTANTAPHRPLAILGIINCHGQERSIGADGRVRMDLTEFISVVRAPTLFVSHKATTDAHRLTAHGKKTAETRGWFAVWS
jgi:hypothetical protein